MEIVGWKQTSQGGEDTAQDMQNCLVYSEHSGSCRGIVFYTRTSVCGPQQMVYKRVMILPIGLK